MLKTVFAMRAVPGILLYIPNARFRPLVGDKLFVLGVVGGFISPSRKGGKYPTLGLPEGECVGLPSVIGSIFVNLLYVYDLATKFARLISFNRNVPTFNLLRSQILVDTDSL